MGRRSAWGNVRKLPSGRYQCRYRVGGVEHTGAVTFRTRAEAVAHLAEVRAGVAAGLWIDPRRAEVLLAAYAKRWLAERPGLRPRTRELYESELRLHILPFLGHLPVGSITPARVRSWHAGLLPRKGASTVAKCYRLLHAVLATAVEDGLLARNPATIRAAGVEQAAERPVATVEEVFRLTAAMPPSLAAMLHLGAFASLRLGEVLALTRCSVDLDAGTVRVVGQVQELATGGHDRGPPKGKAGRRTVNVPAVILPSLADHLAAWVAPEPDALLFAGRDNRPLRRATFYTAWHRATAEAGLPHLRFNDLRHTGNTLSASTGASTRELMARMGHSTPRAALIYQHATRERDAAIARAVSDVVSRALQSAPRQSQ